MEIANYRISKSAWLKDEDHEVVRNIGFRVEDMTGLTVTTAEELQVVNYGIGGHYEPRKYFCVLIEWTASILVYLSIDFRFIKISISLEEKKRMHSKVWELAIASPLFYFT